MQGGGEVALHWVVLSAAPAILAVAPASLLLSLHLLQKSATSGTLLAQYGSDIVAAVVMGLVIMGCCGYALHMLAVSCRAYLKVRSSLVFSPEVYSSSSIVAVCRTQGHTWLT